jgi:hypothetical protein
MMLLQWGTEHTGPVITLRVFVDQVPTRSESTAALAVKKKLRNTSTPTIFNVF